MCFLGLIRPLCSLVSRVDKSSSGWTGKGLDYFSRMRIYTVESNALFLRLRPQHPNGKYSAHLICNYCISYYIRNSDNVVACVFQREGKAW